MISINYLTAYGNDDNNNYNNNNSNKMLYYLCLESTAARLITDETQVITL